MKQTIVLSLLVLYLFCTCKTEKKVKEDNSTDKVTKKVVYQVFTRLFGNTNTTNKPWGTIEENGIGKFADFTDQALQEIKELGITHIWYTGVPHHALVNDYTQYEISNDDPDVIKGRAGSPYAVKDYYNVDPDMAVDPANRLEEFKQLIARTHKTGLKVIVDIVPNHVARKYESTSVPEGVESFGASDDTSVTYKKNNNFYYNPGEEFEVPEWENGYQLLGGEKHTSADAKFVEIPAKWTGNGSHLSQPNFNDWYETVKINYGVSPDGDRDFDSLPEGFDKASYKKHFQFWKDKEVPDSWKKFKDIALYWVEMGVDGFRYDMAEMVPVEFWSYMNSAIKMENPDAFLMAEVYQPDLYRDYIRLGKMDYLYDKVDMYDSIAHIMKGYGWTDHIPVVRDKFTDIEPNLLYFLENHDELRLASPQFLGDARKAKPAMVTLATIGTGPLMIYFGQEVGEDAEEDGGFGDPGRTSIFDYVGVPHHQRWMNDGKFDGGQLSSSEKELRDFYKRLLNFTIKSEALTGDSREIHYYNKEHTENYDHRVFSFVRWKGDEKLLVISNFDAENHCEFELKIPEDIIKEWDLEEGSYVLTDQLFGEQKADLILRNGKGSVKIALNPLQSFIFRLD
ncbi:alpha-amylase family protein [Galbibacter sp. EGI 63066]|uniref:alpha-amylase family protein n=1 Tax=Galbibacter sp. EGI 63066 TaxID=2993559 RepID=UPI0022492D7C|nr:alpha-amylase family protein [Galbibacter sp. EGI 63066]MCX2679911.1 alpha-amylase family protein [Galbibacter sp. EGI 63066]